jgi:hypothetical protein
LFFIPLFPLGTLSEYIECQLCRHSYQPGVLAPGGNLQTDANSPAVQYPGQSNALPNSEIPVKSSSGLPTGLTLGGVLALIFGFGITVLTILTQMDHPDNWAGFFGLLVLCPLPLTVAGLGMLFFGIRMRRQTNATEQHPSVQA